MTSSTASLTSSLHLIDFSPPQTLRAESHVTLHGVRLVISGFGGPFDLPLQPEMIGVVCSASIISSSPRDPIQNLSRLKDGPEDFARTMSRVAIDSEQFALSARCVD